MIVMEGYYTWFLQSMDCKKVTTSENSKPSFRYSSSIDLRITTYLSSLKNLNCFAIFQIYLYNLNQLRFYIGHPKARKILNSSANQFETFRDHVPRQWRQNRYTVVSGRHESIWSDLMGSPGSGVCIGLTIVWWPHCFWIGLVKLGFVLDFQAVRWVAIQ